MRGRPRARGVGRASRSRGAEAIYVGSQHIREVLEEVVGHVEPRARGAAGRRRRRVRRRSRATRRSPALLDEARADPPNPGNASERLPDEGNADAARRASSPATGPTVVYFGKLIENKGVHLLLEALRGARRARGRSSASATTAPSSSAQARDAAGGQTLFTGPLEHRHLVHLLPLADVAVVPSIFPEAFGMVAAEAAAAGCPPLVARHSGLAEVAAGLEESYPAQLRAPRRVRDRRRRRPAREARSAARARRPPTATAARSRPPRGRRALVVGVGRDAAARARLTPRGCRARSR